MAGKIRSERYSAAVSLADEEKVKEVLVGTVLDTKSIKDPIVAFVFDVKGLMADISLKGGKFTKMDK